MKITPTDYKYMADKMAPVMAEHPFAQSAESGFSGKRWRWDAARAAGLIPFFCDTLYKYCDDSHIDTALRAITKTA